MEPLKLPNFDVLYKNQIVELNQRISAANVQITSLDAKITEYSQQLTKGSHLTKEKTTEIANQRKEARVLKDRYTESIPQLETKIKEVEGEWQVAEKTALAVLKTKKESIEKEIPKLEATIDQIDDAEEIIRSRQELDDCRNALSQISEEIKKIERRKVSPTIASTAEKASNVKIIESTDQLITREIPVQMINCMEKHDMIRNFKHNCIPLKITKYEYERKTNTVVLTIINPEKECTIHAFTDGTTTDTAISQDGNLFIVAALTYTSFKVPAGKTELRIKADCWPGGTGAVVYNITPTDTHHRIFHFSKR